MLSLVPKQFMITCLRSWLGTGERAGWYEDFSFYAMKGEVASPAGVLSNASPELPAPTLTG